MKNFGCLRSRDASLQGLAFFLELGVTPADVGTHPEFAWHMLS